MNGFRSVGVDDAKAGCLPVMNFLNEVASTYPAAISFASGRPAERFFQVERWLHSTHTFVEHYASRNALERPKAWNLLAQYGRTNGIINELIAQQVGIDERIPCAGEQIMVTAGCQEAIALCISVLCEDDADVVLVRSPTYIGVTGAAELRSIRLAPVVCDEPHELPGALELEVQRLRARGLRPRALYVVPDFDNPTGTVLSLETRERLLSCCADEEIIILEDNPYGMFCYRGERLPTLAALDTHGCTVYLGTYSKTLCPAVRVGYIVVPRQLMGSADAARRFTERLSIAKSFVTCNTSQFMQVLVGGVLLSEMGSLTRLVAPAASYYRENLRVMTEALEATLRDYRDVLHWNRPAGGFFMTVELPFEFKRREVVSCASEHRAIVMPMSFFSLTDDHDCSVRLAFSNLAPSEIEAGIERFAGFVKSRL